MDTNQLQQTETITWINPASSIEFQASVNSKELHQIESITGMKPEDYNAAAKGKIQYFQDADSLELLLTPNKNTILHIYLTSLSNIELESETKFVEEVLDKCSGLLQQRNAKGEIPLHIAARYGHASIVEVLFERAKASFTDLESQLEVAKEMLGTMNQEADTALHEAVRYNHLEVVRLLLKQDSSFSYSANKAGETLLFMAVERGFKDVTFEILNTCTSPAYAGPLGRTALHAAVFWDDEGIIKRMREKIGILTTLADQKGWTPLHLAANFDCWRAIIPLLKDYRQMAYMKDIEGRTALHLAAYEGNFMVVEKLISSCPDCCELVDKKGKNALHFSVEGKSSIMTTKILVNNPSFANLLNEKDVDGNTALHNHFKARKLGLKHLILHPKIDRLAFNNQNLNILDLVSSEEGLNIYKASSIRRLKRINFGLPRSQRVVTGKPGNKEKKDEGTRSRSSKLDKSDQALSLVATLIATVSFAAGIAMPGGFVGQDGPNPGSAVLARSAAFKAFMVTDSLAFLLSTWAVFTYALRARPRFPGMEFRKFDVLLFYSAFLPTLFALGAMVLAFVTGTYAVLAHHYLDIAIATWIVGPFLVLFILIPLHFFISYFFI